MSKISGLGMSNNYTSKIVCTINQRLAANSEKAAAARMDVVSLGLSQIKKNEVKVETLKPIVAGSGDYCVRFGTAGLFDRVTEKADYLQRDNAEYRTLIEKHLAIANDESVSGEDREISRRMAERLEGTYLKQLENFTKTLSKSFRPRAGAEPHETDEIMKSLRTTDFGLANLQGKDIRDVFEIADNAVNAIRGFAEQLSAVNKEKHGVELERTKPYNDRPQDILNYMEMLTYVTVKAEITGAPVANGSSPMYIDLTTVRRVSYNQR